jgi:N-methylhydantoinase A
MREYQRASTTALNAYTVPIVKPYFDSLVTGLHAMGFSQDLLIMLSSGGVIGAGVAGENPVRMIESGPAAGALAASFYASLLNLPDLISFDMGGTTAKACFIQNHKPLVTNSFEVDRIYRFQQGSGLPVTVPCIDMIEIGAGGGSLAGVDAMDMVTVGPQSAGSTPGPVCYGRGGKIPTVTDADLILGYLDGDNFLGGEVKLDVAGARRAFVAFGERLGLDVERVALGIYELVSEAMASAVRAHATDRGVDWRGVPMLAFGGAGPVHACRVAELIDSRTVIFPPMASVLSAFGTLVTPVRLDLFRSDISELDQLDWVAADRKVSAMIEDATSALLHAGCKDDEIRTSITADVRYKGQHNELPIPIPHEVVRTRDAAAIGVAFEAEYEKVYKIKLHGLPLEIVAWRVVGMGPEVEQPTIKAQAAATAAAARKRTVRFAQGPVETLVRARSSLAVGEKLTGPILIEERETTIVIPPGWSISVDAHGCIFANRKERKVGHHSPARALESSHQHR